MSKYLKNRFWLLLALGLAFNPLAAGVFMVLISCLFPDNSEFKWCASKSGPIYFDEMFLLGHILSLFFLGHLSVRAAPRIGLNSALVVVLIPLFILTGESFWWVQQKLALWREMQNLATHAPKDFAGANGNVVTFQQQVRWGWLVFSCLSCSALLIVRKIIRDNWYHRLVG